MTTKKNDLSVPAATPAGNIEQVQANCLLPSPTQPRKHFDPKAMKELVASIREHGIVQPLIVRLLGPGMLNGKPVEALFEIVSGERRWRAAAEIGLDALPCLVRALTDGQAMEIQTIENLQREDLHPMEEARGYEALLAKCLLTVEQVAAKTGKSKSYIYQRLRLCALVPEAEKFFLDGKLDVTTAFLVARVPAKLQPKCAREVSGVDDKWDPTPMGVRQARQHIERTYMLRLADACFSKISETLVSAAGSCANCPKRTGNDKDLFGDIQGENVCTDPTCYREKQKQHVIQLKLRAENAGRTVLPQDEADKLWQYGSLRYESKYVDLNAQCHDDPKHRTFKQLLGKAAEPVLAVDKDGRPHDLMTKDRVAEALKKAGVKSPAAKRVQESAEQKARAKRETEQRRLMSLVELRVIVAIGKKAKPDATFLRWLALKFLDLWDYEEMVENAALRRFPKEGDHAVAALTRAVPKMSVAELVPLIAEMLAKLEDAKTFRVDVKALEKTVKAEEKAKGKGLKAKGQPMPGVCSKCGCTENEPCELDNGEACSWTDATRTLCTKCAPAEKK